MVGLNFPDEKESSSFFRVVQEHVSKQAGMFHPQTPIPCSRSHSAPTGATQTQEVGRSQPLAPAQAEPAGVTKGGGWFKGQKKEKPKSKKRGKLSTIDISVPSNFVYE